MKRVCGFVVYVSLNCGITYVLMKTGSVAWYLSTGVKNMLQHLLDNPHLKNLESEFPSHWTVLQQVNYKKHYSKKNIMLGTHLATSNFIFRSSDFGLAWYWCGSLLYIWSWRGFWICSKISLPRNKAIGRYQKDHTRQKKIIQRICNIYFLIGGSPCEELSQTNPKIR